MCGQWEECGSTCSVCLPHILLPLGTIPAGRTPGTGKYCANSTMPPSICTLQAVIHPSRWLHCGMKVSLREAGYWGWGIFSFVWLCAFIGTTLCFCRLKEHSYLETICYIAMGCSIFVAFKPLCNHVPSLFIYWLIAEGVSYITGAVFYSFHKLPYMHSVFHLFVLGGTICHMIALWYIL